MTPEESKVVFIDWLTERRLDLSSLLPSQGIEAMLEFYSSVRANGCVLGDDDDMLLYQWGTYNWEDREYFELDITRQFISGGYEDENFLQLSLTFRFEPTEEMCQWDSGNKWCASPQYLAPFRSFINTTVPYDQLHGVAPKEVKLDLDRV